jgi:acetyltransferase-like isoleucine patch superfamily enzyme
LKGATLKYGCRIGSGAILLPAVTVGKLSVVNAGEVVRKDIPDSTLFFTKKGKEIYKPIKSDPIKEM